MIALHFILLIKQSTLSFFFFFFYKKHSNPLLLVADFNQYDILFYVLKRKNRS
jgi:hypothetical protein